MRVVLLVTDLERGGTPLRLARLARGLSEAGVETAVGCLAPRGPVSDDLEAAGIPTFSCDARHARDFLALKRLADHLRRLRPDLLHATLTHANVAARLVGLYLHIPVLTSTATIEVERRWHRWAERLTAHFDRGHVVNSAALADHVARAFWLPRRRVSIVPPMPGPTPPRVDRAHARAALGIPDHEFVILWMGRFDPVKRLDLLVKCAEILSVIPARFLLAGDGPDRPNVERAVRLSSAARSVHLLGWQDDVVPLLSAADAFFFPSRTEGMPNAVLLAMAAGLPIVASDIPTLRELTGDEERLLLIRGDQPKPYADALFRLYESPDLRRTLGQRAAAWSAAHLNPQEAVAAVLRVYERTLRGRLVTQHRRD